jgi:uncharacterized protein YjbI with pentapeptide repeats
VSKNRFKYIKLFVFNLIPFNYPLIQYMYSPITYQQKGSCYMASDKHLAQLKLGVTVWNEWRQQNPGIKPNLVRANLSDLDLNGANLCDANLTGANLERANLSGAKLERANLSYAKLIVADLTGADLAGASLEWADLEWAGLFVADLTGANLTGATLEGAALNWANMNGTIMPDGTVWADMNGTITEEVAITMPEKKWLMANG